ncbi:glycosyltransferase family 1 protein [Luteitalea sp.]
MSSLTSSPDLICFSHLRWDFVWQRPQHLLTRAARHRRVWFVEEPIVSDGPPRLDVTQSGPRLSVVVPKLPAGLSAEQACQAQRALLAEWWQHRRFRSPLLWYYTPMAMAFTRALPAGVVVYDCMDDLTMFKGAPAVLPALEAELLERADLVFTGGVSLYEAKKHQHRAVQAFPSSVDKAHFLQARQPMTPPADQARIPGPRIGFFGVIDERLDVDLLAGLAALRPDQQFVLIGPTVKIDPASLPTAPNVHYLGMKSYSELPAYLAGWDVAILPFARNDATRFISPTKTPEYLAAGCPVVSTSIADVVRPYGVNGLARIADTPEAFAAALDDALAEGRGGVTSSVHAPPRSAAHLARADAMLAGMSWDRTWQRMQTLIDAVTREASRTSQGRATTAAPVGTVAAGPTA